MRKKTMAAADPIEQSVWAQADEFLAKALFDCILLCAKIDRRRKKAASDVRKALAAIEGEALLVRQSISEAAALRGLASFGEAGDICSFDPSQHELKDKKGAGKSPGVVEIKTPGVLANRQGVIRVLIRAKVTLSKRRRKSK